MQTFKNRVFVETDYLGANVACISTKKGLIAIDSPFLPEDARDWAKRLRERTGQDVAYQINTDHHFDHVMGNAFLTDNVICHSTAARGIEFLRDKNELKGIIRASFPDVLDSLESELDDLRIPSPLITFKQKMTLDLEDATVVLEFVGGHSPATILIYLVEDKVAFTGDNVEGLFPYFGQGRFNGWQATLRKILAMDIDVLVPGHGPVGGRELAERYLVFFQKLEEEVKALAADGCTVEQMVDKSEMISFFPLTEMEEEGFRMSWIQEQYQSAARQILAEG
jgi:cyclase